VDVMQGMLNCFKTGIGRFMPFKEHVQGSRE
jgi:hypothetical protein